MSDRIGHLRTQDATPYRQARGNRRNKRPLSYLISTVTIGTVCLPPEFLGAYRCRLLADIGLV